ncbi:MAG: hypothetical protein IKZ41_09410, partial [Clostridia bacterium]|nr:hypothetical protein [Clostridia bacterium]
MKTKILALLLAALMIFPSLVSCSNSGSNPENTESPAAQTPEVVPEETEPAEDINSRLAEKDDLPEADFGGRDFIVFGSDEEGFGVYIYTEEMNGEGVNDAVYQRNLTVEERFNAKTVYSGVATYGTCSSQITAAVASGDSDSFDLVQYHVVSSSGNAMKGEYLNWYDIPHVDFTRSWWSPSNINDLTIAGRCYLAIGDFALSSVGRSYVMLYDKDEAKNYQLEDLYTVVKEGRWTIDALRNVCSVVYTDTNGDGKENDGDYFGLGTDSYSNLNTYLWACDNQIFSRGDTGELEFRYYSEHLVDVYDACWNLLNQMPGVFKKGEHKAGMKL